MLPQCNAICHQNSEKLLHAKAIVSDGCNTTLIWNCWNWQTEKDWQLRLVWCRFLSLRVGKLFSDNWLCDKLSSVSGHIIPVLRLRTYLDLDRIELDKSGLCDASDCHIGSTFCVVCRVCVCVAFRPAGQGLMSQIQRLQNGVLNSWAKATGLPDEGIGYCVAAGLYWDQPNLSGLRWHLKESEFLSWESQNKTRLPPVKPAVELSPRLWSPAWVSWSETAELNRILKRQVTEDAWRQQTSWMVAGEETFSIFFGNNLFFGYQDNSWELHQIQIPFLLSWQFTLSQCRLQCKRLMTALNNISPREDDWWTILRDIELFEGRFTTLLMWPFEINGQETAE